MNTPSRIRLRGVRPAVLLAGLVLAPFAAHAQGGGIGTGTWVGADDDKATFVGSQVHVVVEADEDGNLERHAIEMRVDDGEISIRMDGKEIPADRMRIENGAITLLDENGKPIESVHLNIGGNQFFGAAGAGVGLGGGARDLFVGGGVGQRSGNDFSFGAVEEPKVMLGIHLGVPDDVLEHHLRLEPGTTTLVTALYENLPAHAAGVGRYDVITEIDGLKPANPKALRELLATKEPGDRVSLRVIHEGRPKTVEITLSAYDAKTMMQAKMIGNPERLGGLFRTFVGPDGDPQQGQIWSMDIDKLPYALVAPDQRTFELPHLGGQGAAPAPELHGRLRRLLPGGEADEQEFDVRLERLHDRMKDLEHLLDEVLERARREATRP